MKNHSMMIRRLVLWVPLLLSLVLTAQAQSGVRAVVVNEFANVRFAPALGAEVFDTVNAGYVFENINGRTADSQWLRVDYQGIEAWVNVATLTILSGDVNGLEVGDPRFIPFGGTGSPRAGSTSAGGQLSARTLYNSRLRAGPSTAYPTILNVFHSTNIGLTGRTANTLWYQVVVDGTLGWIHSELIEVTEAGFVGDLPVGGIVADAGPVLGDSADDYVATLRNMLARLDLAQPSLDQIRASWTDAALNGRAQCSAYPARPSNYPVPLPLLNAYYDNLNPLQQQFNDAMYNVRLAIDLFIEVCNQPGTANPVGQATIQGALDTINLADGQFAGLRARLLELLPPDRVVGADECLLSYEGQVEILPLLNLGTIYLEEFTARKFIAGYCFDIIEGNVYTIQTLQLPPSNVASFVAVTELNNPSDFLALGDVGQGGSLTIGPLIALDTTRVLLIIADLGDEEREGPPQGDFAILVSDVTGDANQPRLVYNEENGSVNIETVANPAADTGGLTEEEQQQSADEQTGEVCPSLAFTCAQLFTCGEARACLNAGNFELDPDGDGIPCEESLCTDGET